MVDWGLDAVVERSTFAPRGATRNTTQLTSPRSHPRGVRDPAIAGAGVDHLAWMRALCAAIRLSNCSRATSSIANARVTIKAPSWGLPLANDVLGTVSQLLCEVGSRVQHEEVVAVVESDKVAVDIKAMRSGVISAILVSVGDDVKVRQPIYALDTVLSPPPRGSSEEQHERRWAGVHARRLEEEKKEEERIWLENQERKQGADSGEWRWQSSAREWQHRQQEQQQQQQQFRHRQYQHQHPRGQRVRWQRQNARTSKAAPWNEPPPPDLVGSEPEVIIQHVLTRGHQPKLCLGFAAHAVLEKEQIRKRYRQLILLVHPDKCRHPQAEAAFLKLGKALDQLL